MTDRELLELAAKAADLAAVWSEWITGRTVEFGCIRYTKNAGFRLDGRSWNPLEDDGDALRLAVKIGINPDWDGFDVEICRRSSGARNFCYVELHENDPYAATRRVIVEAAAAIGKALK